MSYSRPDNNGGHEKVEKSGTESVDFMIYSLDVHLPDTICLISNGGGGASRSGTATGYPGGGQYEWETGHSAISVSGGNSCTASISLSDTSVTNGKVIVTFSIDGVSYKKEAYVKVCGCNCESINQTITLGPISFNANVAPLSPSPSNNLCTYDVKNVSFTLKMKGNVTKQAATSGANVSFKRDCESQEVTSAHIDWTGDAGVGEIGFLSFNAKSFSIDVSSSGTLSGSVTLNTRLNKDKDLTNKGIKIL